MNCHLSEKQCEAAASSMGQQHTKKTPVSQSFVFIAEDNSLKSQAEEVIQLGSCSFSISLYIQQYFLAALLHAEVF